MSLSGRVRSACVTLLFVLVSASAWAEQDFYGIQMKSEEWARALVLNEGSPDPAELAKGPVLSHAIHAEGSLKEIAERHVDFRVTVFNDTESSIDADYHFRDFLVYTRDGKKYSLVDTEEGLPSFIEPRTKLSFAPSFGNLLLRNSDVEMIVCSFDLGATKIILFPWSKKEALSKLVSPQPPPVTVKDEKKRPLKKESKKIQKQEVVKEKNIPERGPRKKTPKRNFWDWLAWNDGKHKTPEDLKRAPVMPTAVEPSAPATKNNLDQAIKNFVYTPSVETMGASASSVVPEAPARNEARVIDFNKKYNFVTLNLGEKDGLRNGTMLSIERDGKPVAKAKVKQVRGAVSAAAILPESVRREVRSGDVVAFV